jgi:hypothetical protein
MFYKITLLNNQLDKSEADVVLFQIPQGHRISVQSKNKKMQTHLERVLSTEFHLISPGKLSATEATVCAMDIKPDTLEYFQLIPEIVGWKGYKAEFNSTVHKSVDLLGGFVVLKDADIYNNAKGQRIVKHVPAGMIAVHRDGRVVGGGRYLNANIDKEGAEWTLEQNPYEGQQPAQRANARADHELGMEQYHPGMDEETYSNRQQEDDTQDYHKLRDTYERKGKTLEQAYGTLPVAQVEQVLSNAKVSLPSHLPPKLASDVIVYSPEMGVAFDSAFWPPVSMTGFENADWFAFEYPEIDELDYDDMVEILGMSPQFVKGVKKGPVRVDKKLPVEDGILINLPPTLDSTFSDQDDNQTIIINKPVVEKFALEDLDSPEMAVKVTRAREVVSKWKDMTSFVKEDGSRGVNPKVDEIKIPELRGINANFTLEPYGYQRPVIQALTEPEQYEKFGGPRGVYGHYLNLTYGAGKTPIILAAEAKLRNKGMIKNGTQTTLITAPSKNIHVWASEIEKFRNESAVVIDGHKHDRIAQWENLLEKARDGRLPNFVVVSGSKFRMGNETVEGEDGEETKEIGLDAKYMKLLSLGGKSQGKSVKGGHVGVMVLDETGNYVNPKSSRYKAVTELTEAVYYGDGLVWTLNGDLSGNSAADTISEMSFVNMYARDHNALSGKYTIPDPNRPASGARAWKAKALPDFMAKFRNQIYSLDGKTIAGDEYGLTYTEDLSTPLGHNWGRTYSDSLEKMELIMEMGGKGASRALGMLSILIGSSYGSVSPARLLEYDIGTKPLLDIRSLTDAETYSEFREELRTFLSEVAEDTVEVGRLPKEKMQVQMRDDAYNRAFSASSKNLLDKAIERWDNPALEEIMKSIGDSIKSSKGQPIKLGVAGFSKRAIQSLYKRLKNQYNESSVLVLKFDGDTASEDIGTQQKQHQQEDDRYVISLVTGAGLYGLSLAAERSWVFATWNPAKLGQYGGRYHRNPMQKNVLTVVVPTGTSEYIRNVEQSKKDIQNAAKSELLEIDMDDDGEVTSAGQASMTRLIDRLKYYSPKILSKESRSS